VDLGDPDGDRSMTETPLATGRAYGAHWRVRINARAGTRRALGTLRAPATFSLSGRKRGLVVEVPMALRDEIDKIQEVLKANEKSMISPDRELFHSILSALKDIEDASRPKVMKVGDGTPRAGAA
jgi:hypothetical protein